MDGDLSEAFGRVAEVLAAFAEGVARYREAMEESKFEEAAELVGQGSVLLSNVATAVNNISPELRKM